MRSPPSSLSPFDFTLYSEDHHVWNDTLYRWQKGLPEEFFIRTIQIVGDGYFKKHDSWIIHRSLIVGSLSFFCLVPDFIMYSPISRKVTAPAMGGTQFPRKNMPSEMKRRPAECTRSLRKEPLMTFQGSVSQSRTPQFSRLWTLRSLNTMIQRTFKHNLNSAFRRLSSLDRRTVKG